MWLTKDGSRYVASENPNHVNHKRTNSIWDTHFEYLSYTVSPVRWETYFLVNRVENQKLNQTTAELPFGWVFGFQLGLR